MTCILNLNCLRALFLIPTPNFSKNLKQNITNPYLREIEKKKKPPIHSQHNGICWVSFHSSFNCKLSCAQEQATGHESAVQLTGKYALLLRGSGENLLRTQVSWSHPWWSWITGAILNQYVFWAYILYSKVCDALFSCLHMWRNALLNLTRNNVLDTLSL